MKNNCIFIGKIVVNEAENTAEYNQYVKECLSDLTDTCMMHSEKRSDINPVVCKKVE